MTWAAHGAAQGRGQARAQHPLIEMSDPLSPPAITSRAADALAAVSRQRHHRHPAPGAPAPAWARRWSTASPGSIRLTASRGSPARHMPSRSMFASVRSGRRRHRSGWSSTNQRYDFASGELFTSLAIPGRRDDGHDRDGRLLLPNGPGARGAGARRCGSTSAGPGDCCGRRPDRRPRVRERRRPAAGPGPQRRGRWAVALALVRRHLVPGRRLRDDLPGDATAERSHERIRCARAGSRRHGECAPGRAVATVSSS